MKNLSVFILCLWFSINTQAQDIVGQWHGQLEVGASSLPLIFNINKIDKGWSVTIDSPSQGSSGIPASSVTFEDNQLTINVARAKMQYIGRLENDIFKGTFSQGGRSQPLDLSREAVKAEVVVKKQTPKAPFSYQIEEHAIENKAAGVTLGATLTKPRGKGPFPAVLLVSGSGPQNRNEEIGGHEPFWVLADHLTKQGIAVLRYDDRGVEASTGDFTSATTNDLAEDAEVVFEYLKLQKNIDASKVGIMGHSEGGLIAPMIAARNSSVAFIVSLAGPGMKGSELMLLQKRKIESEMGVPLLTVVNNDRIFRGAYDIILENDAEKGSLESQLKTYFKSQYGAALPENQLNTIVRQFTNPWFQDFIAIDPADYLTKVKCPVLALIGEKDLQVPSEENIAAIEAALKTGGNENYKMMVMPSLNHLFQTADSGLPSEYETLEETFSPTALESISNWLKKMK